jgi:glucose/arabinose dehydrogenase
MIPPLFRLAPVGLAVLLFACGGSGTLDDDDTAPTDDDDAVMDDDDVAQDCEGIEPVSGTDIAFEEVISGLSAPVFVTHAGDGSGRLFVCEQGGRISVWHPDDGLSTWFDIRTRVVDWSELGLLSVAFHPDFESNGRAFIYYNEQAGDLTWVVSEIVVTGDPATDAVDPDSEMVLITGEQPASNHNGGQVGFGPDGYLYIGLGDGGGAGDSYGNGQRKDTFLSKMLRIDVDASGAGEFGNYGVPADNPFVDDATHRPETWAWGLRNPWRFSWDRQTGDLWIADVGQNMWEELDRGVAGANYGWPEMESNHCYNAGCDPSEFEPAFFEYGHSTGISITGGYVYRGCVMEDLLGVYFYSDYNYWNAPLWTLHLNETSASGGPISIAYTDILISSFGEDERGEIYVCGHGDGRVYRIVPATR